MVRARIAVALLWVPVAWALITGMKFYLDNRDNATLVSSGESRSYLLHVPEGLDPARPVPLVISLHGGAAWPALQRDTTGWDKLADEEGFIVVFPAGMRADGSSGPRVWNIYRPWMLEGDVRFIEDLIDTLEARYNIDPARIYVDGLSAGAGMAFALSCTIGERIAAVGMVASALLLPADWCPDPRPMPLMIFHGKADKIAPYHGGTSIVLKDTVQEDVEQFTATWARRNGCAPDARETVVARGITRRDWTDCLDGNPVVMYTIEDGGHTWPGSTPEAPWLLGKTRSDVEATRELWSFYEMTHNQ